MCCDLTGQWLLSVTTPVFDLCYLIVVWLSLGAGVSREAGNRISKALNFIMFTIVRLIQIVLAPIGIKAILSRKINIPGEIRTIYTHFELKPEILCVICCPQCFKQYTTGVVPLQCTWRHSPHSRPCGADLYVARHTHNGLNRVPKCLYTSQSFDSWLAFLLSRPQIDDCLHQTFAKLQNPFNPTACMHNIHDSPAWYSFRPFLQSCYYLVFAMYIDWFNPFTNKIAGEYSCIPK